MDSAGLHVKEIAVGRARFQLRFAGTALRDAYSPAFEHLEAAASDGTRVTITFWDSESAGVQPPSSPFRPGDLVGQGGEIAAAGDPSIRVLCIPGLPVFMAWDSDRESAIVWAGSAAALPGYELAHPVRTIMQWALERYGLHLVHAACVAGTGGGVLLAGFSGAGKSTTAVACVERGLGYLGDDMVAITDDSEPHAHSIYSAAKLDARSVELLGGLHDIPRGKPVHDPRKSVLLLANSRRDRMLRETRLCAVIVPTTAAGPGLRSIGRAASLRALAAPSILLLPSDARAVLRSLANVVRAVPSFELGLNEDPASAAGEIADLCGPVGVTR